MHEAGQSVSISISDCVGITGSIVIVVVYFMNLRGTLRTTGLTYSLLNLFGATMILYSLAQKWNLAAVVMEGFWAAISMYGLARAIHQRYEERPR